MSGDEDMKQDKSIHSECNPIWIIKASILNTSEIHLENAQNAVCRIKSKTASSIQFIIHSRNQSLLTEFLYIGTKLPLLNVQVKDIKACLPSHSLTFFFWHRQRALNLQYSHL